MRLFLCGDVMTGRGFDQALPHPVNPVLYEPYVRDAREYVQLAEKAHGSIPRPLSFDYTNPPPADSPFSRTNTTGPAKPQEEAGRPSHPPRRVAALRAQSGSIFES